MFSYFPYRSYFFLAVTKLSLSDLCIRSAGMGISYMCFHIR